MFHVLKVGSSLNEQAGIPLYPSLEQWSSALRDIECGKQINLRKSKSILLS